MCTPIRTRSGPVAPHGSLTIARSASAAAASASWALAKTAWTPSPVVFTIVPVACLHRVAEDRVVAGERILHGVGEVFPEAGRTLEIGEEERHGSRRRIVHAGRVGQTLRTMSPVFTVPGTATPRHHAAEVELAPERRQDELRRVVAEPSSELRAAGVGDRGDLDDRGTELEPRAGRQVRGAEVEVEVELVAGERAPFGVDGHQRGEAGVHQRDLHVGVRRAVAGLGARLPTPHVTDESLDEVELGRVEHLAFASCRTTDDELDRPVVGWRPADLGHAREQFLRRAMRHRRRMDDGRATEPLLSRAVGGAVAVCEDEGSLRTMVDLPAPRVLTGERGTAVVAVGFVTAIAIAAVLLFTGTGESADLNWKTGAAVPGVLSPGATVVDDAIPVEVAPDVQAWTGSELLTFGTRGSRNVGAVYEPSTGRWRGDERGPVRYRAAGTGGGVDGQVLGRRRRPLPVGPPAVRRHRRGGRLRAGHRQLDRHRREPAAGCGQRTRPRDPSSVAASACWVRTRRSSSTASTTRSGPTPGTGIGSPHHHRPTVSACSVDRDVVVADVESSTVSVLEPGATAWDVERTRDRAIESATAATVCTDASLVAFAPDLRSVAAFDVAARRWSAIAPPPFPATGPLVGAFTGKIALFYRPEETVTYGPQSAAWRPAPPGITAPPDRVAWTDEGYGLFVVDDRTLVAYNAGV